MYLEDLMPEFIKLADNGVHIYLMHLDVENKIKEMIDGTALRFAKLYDK